MKLPRAMALLSFVFALIVPGCTFLPDPNPGPGCTEADACPSYQACDGSCEGGACVYSPPGCEESHPDLGETSSALCTVPTNGTTGYVEATSVYIDSAGVVPVTVTYPAAGVTVQPQMLVLLSGGGFTSHITDARTYARVLAGVGYVSARVDYRLSPTSVRPAQVSDAYCGMRYAASVAATYGASSAHIVIVGMSAGGEIGMAAGLTAAAAPTGWDDGTCSSTAAIPVPVGIAAESGLYNFAGTLTTAATTAVTYELGYAPSSNLTAALAASPQPYVGNTKPPVYMMHAGNDPLIPIGQATAFLSAATTVSETATLVYMTGLASASAHDPPIWTSFAGTQAAACGLLAFIASL